MKKNISSMPFDIEQLFAENANLTASGTIGVDVDLKGLGYNSGTVVLDVLAIETGGSEVYDIRLTLAVDAGFVTSEVIISRFVTETGTIIIPFMNQGEEMYRFARLSAVIVGGTADITLNAYISEDVLPKRTS